jgi:hypothetical protein
VPKVHNKPIKRPRKGSNNKSKIQPKGSPGLAHRIVRCTTGQRSVHQGTQLQTGHLREFWESLCYNSPDCSVCERSNGYTAPSVVCNGIVKVKSARLRAQKSEQRQKAHRTVRWPSCQKLQRSESNGLVTWLAHRAVSGGAPDCPVRHTTEAFTNGQLGGWGYKYPQPPHFNVSNFSAIKPHTRAIDFIPRHNQIDQILSQVRNHSKQISDYRERHLCSFELLRLDCFYSSFVLVSNSIGLSDRLREGKG